MSRGVGRKSTGIFNDRDWGKNVQLQRESSVTRSSRPGLLVAEGLKEVIYVGLRVGLNSVACEAESLCNNWEKLPGRRR